MKRADFSSYRDLDNWLSPLKVPMGKPGGTVARMARTGPRHGAGGMFHYGEARGVVPKSWNRNATGQCFRGHVWQFGAVLDDPGFTFSSLGDFLEYLVVAHAGMKTI
jgi:hypothetical protein